MTSEVMSISQWRTNGEMIADVAKLYFKPYDRILDATFGKGNFWTDTPRTVVTANDMYAPSDPTFPMLRYDFRNFPPHWQEFYDIVVFDPPYGYRGTSRHKMDEAYGIDGPYLAPNKRDELIVDGVTEACRVSRRLVLAKVQDQVVSGKVRWQTHFTTQAAEKAGFFLRDSFLFQSYNQQPAGRRQVHARRNYSTLLVLERAKNA